MLIRRLEAGLAAMAMAVAPWLTGQAVAACGLTPEAVAAAETVFVGTLNAVNPGGTSATFLVEDIWKGSGLSVGEPAAIDTTNAIQSLSLPPPGAGLSRYLVLAKSVDGQLHSGSGCELFHFPWDASYAAFRPPDAPPPMSRDAQLELPVLLIPVVVVVVLLATVSILAFRSPPKAED